MSNELILVVDDEPDILGLCERILAGSGHNVYTASSGARAIKIARATPLDVVLLDLQMPDGDGITIFEAIRGYQPDTVGIVITGYPSMEAAIDALRRGFSGFVLKPFTPNELRQAVFDALERRRLERDYARLQALIPLYELSRFLMTTIDIDVLLDQVVEMAVTETGADRASLMLERDRMLYIEAARGLPEGIMDATATPVGEGIAGWVAEHGEPLLLNRNVSMPPELADALTREDIASAICAPLALYDRVIGVLNLTKLEPTARPFTPSDRDLITVLAGQVAIAIENARLFREQRSLTRELTQANINLRALQQAATAITSRLSPERVLQTILDRCAGVMNQATIALGLLNSDSGTIQVHLHHGETQRRETTALPLQEPEIKAIESQSQAMDVLEQRLKGLLMDVARPAAVGVIPLVAQDQLLGAMAVGTRQELTEADILTFTPFADHAAVAIANARLFARLQRAYEELRELDQLKSESITIAAYELRSPLLVINAYTELLSEAVPENLQSGLEKLRDATRQLEQRIDNLLELRGLELGRSVLREEPVAVGEVVASMVECLEPLVDRKGLELQLEVPRNLSTIMADRTKLETIIASLMSNAIKFTPSGGKIGVQVEATESEIHVAVRDTGPGIPAERKVSVFGQSDGATDSRPHEHGEAGLGLPVARRLAELHGGYIKLDSEPGKGSTFTLGLPLARNNSTG